MELEVAVPVDFNFDSACSSPYMTAPSSPQRFGNFFLSAPPSPTRISSFYSDLSVPFRWEEKPGVPKPTADNNSTSNRDGDGDGVGDDDDEDFEFDFSGQLDRPSLSAADELFDGGKIRPLKPPPRLQTPAGGSAFDGNYVPGALNSASPRSPKSRICQGKKMVQEALAMSPRRRKDFEIDPFAAAIEETRKKEENQNLKRGREIRAHNSSSFGRKGTRSLSPMRISDVVFEAEESSAQTTTTTATITSKASNSGSAYSSILSAFSFATDYKKWKLKDLLLFRSASEGRAPRNDDVLSRPSKYAMLSSRKSTASDDVRNSSFRSTDSVGSVSSRRRGVPVSAHELHYTANRAVSEEMKKKTFLPYKQGLLGCLGFNPGVHDISRRVGSLSRT